MPTFRGVWLEEEEWKVKGMGRGREKRRGIRSPHKKLPLETERGGRTSCRHSAATFLPVRCRLLSAGLGPGIPSDGAQSAVNRTRVETPTHAWDFPIQGHSSAAVSLMIARARWTFGWFSRSLCDCVVSKFFSWILSNAHNELTNLRNYARNAVTSLLDRPITAASDDGVYAAGTLPSCGRHARNYWK